MLIESIDTNYANELNIIMVWCAVQLLNSVKYWLTNLANNLFLKHTYIPHTLV